MASSSSSSSSGRSFTYDVFLNFRGEDTRKIFVGHLYRALTHRGLEPFIDSEGLRKGNHLSVLLKAITDSKISIVVFSQDYASSTWCLKELVQIMKCKADQEQEQIVVPVFYEVDPSHVRKQEGSFAQAFSKHESNKDLNLQEVQSALNEAASLVGWDSTKYEDDAKLIDDIVDHVFNEWSRISSSKNNHWVGMDSHLHEMRQLLRLKTDDDVLRVGIWGMGGIGKTTIAMEVYDEIRSQFDHHYFLPNVKEGFGNQVRMQEQLLSGIFKTQVLIHTLNDGYKMMEKLSMKKVLVVLDDVDNPHQIETLLGRKPSFGGGSRIIVTTRDSHVLTGFEWYGVKLLSDRDAHKLFCQFKINKPSEKYDHLSRLAVKYAQGLPLALRVLGSSLHNRSASEWEYVLDKLKEIPDLKIQEVLKTSFDGLDRTLKGIFLDIACFFRGKDKDYVTKVLQSCGFRPQIGLKVLVERALLTISDSNKLEMHDLLQEMGREIESTKEPGKQSRFWSSADVERVLTGKKDMENVEGLMIKLPDDGEEKYFNAEAFIGMRKLRLLRITHWDRNGHTHNGKNHVNGDLDFLSDALTVLVWYRCPLKSLPSNFHMKNLVDLDISFGHIKQLWEGTKPAKNLRSINLRGCKYLNKTPNLTEVTNLEELHLEGCTSLSEVHPSISALTNLVFLSLNSCTKLKSLPSSIHMKSLKTLVLSGCSNLEMFPEISEDMEALSELKLDGTAIKELPSSIERLRGLKSLDMEYCAIVRLPERICNLAKLRFLNLKGCSKLYNLPENLGNLESLRELLVDQSGIKQLPVSILHLKLSRLSFDGCKQMEAPLSSWSSSIEGRCTVVVHINLSNCNLLELSDGIACFPSLKKLTLSKNNLESLPAIMNQLVCLEQLELDGCKRLKSIPELSSSISYINADDCTALETVSTPKCPYDMGRFFTFFNCSQLVQNDLFRDIVETHFPPQGNYSRLFFMCFPGSEIPERFIHRCSGSSVTAHLPPNLFDNKFLGFAICAVTNKPQAVDYFDLSAICFCAFKGNHCEYRFSFYLFVERFRRSDPDWSKSNHMFVRYVPWSEFGINGEEVNGRCYTEAKFEIQLKYHEIQYMRAGFDPNIERCDPCIEKCGVQFFFANNEEVGHEDSGEPMVHSERSLEGCSAEPSGDMTSDTCHEEQYLELLSKLFDGPNKNSEDIYAYLNESDYEIEDHEVQVDNSERNLEGCAAEPSGSALATDTSDKDEQYLQLSELVDGANRNYRDVYGNISDESDCEIEDNDPSGKRKIVSWWRQKVRVTSGPMQGDLDDGFSWNHYGRGCIPEQGTGYLRYKYHCNHRLSCLALSKMRISVNDPISILKIKYIGRHTCWKTLPMLTHQVRVTPDMGLEAEGPFDGFSWGEYGQMNLPGAKHPIVCYVCTPQNVRGCMAIKEVQRSNDDPTILKITYRGRHTCIQAYTISIGGRGDGRISEGGCALRIHDQVVQSPRSLGDNGSGGNVIRLADRAMDDNNVNMLPDANSQDMEHSQDVNHMANKNMAGYPNHGGCVSEGTSDAVVNQKRVSLWKRTLRNLRSLCTSIASRKKK